MALLEEESILYLPDEVIEHIMTFLSFADLFKLIKEGTRLGDCAKRGARKKPFRKYGTQKPIISRNAVKIQHR